MTTIDYLIIGVYLMSIFYVGIRYRDRSSSFSTFMIAGRRVGLSLGVATMLGTELGLITVMYNAQTGFQDFFSAFHIGLFALIVTIFGIAESELVLSVIMIVLLLMVLIYTTLGGMISVIITDYIQFVVLSIGMILSVLCSIYYLGWSNIFAQVETLAQDTSAIYNPIQSRGGFYISWQIVLGFVSAVIWPTAITRALSLDSAETVKRQYLWSSASFLIRFMVPCFLGICAFVYFNGLTPDSSWEKLAMMPRYLSEILPMGLLGLMVAAMLAAFMSTHDSYLLCWSTIITNDIIDPIKGGTLTSSQKINYSRVIIVLLGAYILYWGLMYDGDDSIWDYLGITGAIYFTGAISVILFGVYWKKASSAGAMAALLGGLSALVGLEPIRESIPMISSFKPEEIGLMTLGFSILLMISFSLLMPDRQEAA